MNQTDGDGTITDKAIVLPITNNISAYITQ